MHLADAFIQSIQVIHFLSVFLFPGNWAHNLCAANAMLYHWATGTIIEMCVVVIIVMIIWDNGFSKRKSKQLSKQ